MNKIDPMAAALSRGFGPGGKGAPPPPPKYVPRALRDGEIELGRASNGDVVGLHIGKLVEGRLLIQGNSGAGKSMLLRRLFEQAFGKVQQLVIDPEGEFISLAEKFDATTIDAATALRVGGRALGFHLREHRYSAVLDLSDATNEQRLQIVADLAAALIEAPPAHWHPLLVLVDETQSLAPHYYTGDVDTVTRLRAITALADMMARGRKRGVAGVIATQRIAETSKAVVAKAINVIVGCTVFDVDQERAGAAIGFTAGAARALRTLAPGTFLCLGPALAGPNRVRFRGGPTQSQHKGEAPVVAAPPIVPAAKASALLKDLPSVEPSAEADTVTIRQRGRRGKDMTWTPQEDQIIRDGYKNGDKIAVIIERLATVGRTITASYVSMRAKALGFHSMRVGIAWSDAEDIIIRDGYAREVRMMDIVKLLEESGFQRSRVSVQMRAIALGITRDRVNYWTEPEKAIAIAGLEAGKPHREVLADLCKAGYHRGHTSIFKFAQKHNFVRKGDSWTADDIGKMEKMYADKVPPKQIAEALGKSIGAIRTKASNLGLKQRIAWSEQEYKILRDYHNAGKTLTAAAERIGRPFPNVARVATDIGLSFERRTVKPKKKRKARK